MSFNEGSIFRGDNLMSVIDLLINMLSSILITGVDIIERGINTIRTDSGSTTIVSMNFNNHLTGKSKN
jgi:hypothetical protein